MEDLDIHGSAEGIVFDVRRFSVHDGPGIRSTVFLKGCPLSCWWCHNPESQRSQPQVFYRPARCIQCGRCVEACPQGAIAEPQDGGESDPALCIQCGQCARVCPAEARELAGRRVTAKGLLAELERDVAFYDESGGGVTFSGGEPLQQARFLEELLPLCKAHDLHVALDTSGCAAWPVIDRLRPYVDLFLYDIKLMDAEKHLRYTGVSNQLILDNLLRLSESGARIFLRVPVVPGINDDPANLDEIGRLAASLPGVERVDLLPYHQAAAVKYANLGVEYRLDDIQPPSPDAMQALAARLGRCGVSVHIGG
jgi:pyruvate formate lyase activating enzyme